MTNTPKPEESLARVSILKYADKTGTPDYGYMPQSLTEAIDKSLQKRFQYIREEPQTSEKKAEEIRKKRKSFGAKEAEEFCKATNSDILIFGSFTYDEKADDLVIETSISLGSVEKFRVLQPVRNKVDNTLFKAVEVVADSIVKEMMKIAQEQQKKDGKKEQPGDKKEKVKIQKIDKSFHWKDYNWMISLGVGPTVPFIKTDTAQIQVRPSASLVGTRNLWGFLQAGFMTGVYSVQSKSNNIPQEVITNISVVDAVALAGYYYDFSARWRFTGQAGGGYYFGKLNLYTECSSSCTLGGLDSARNIQNPLFLARGAIHYLWFSFLSVGFLTEIRTLYDKPKPVFAGSVGFIVTGVF